MSSLPIVFIHSDISWYVPYTLNQANLIDPESEVILLSDGSYKDRIVNAKVVNFNSLPNSAAMQFRQTYRHMSSHTIKYEIFCWLRWFYLLSYMESHNLTQVLYLDSDVLLFQPVKYILAHYHDILHDCALMIPQQSHQSYRWTASGHISYWTKPALQKFCDFAIKSYQDQKWLSLYEEKWRWHIDHKIPGGICDMTTLYLFWRDHRDSITNFAKEHKGSTFDLSFGSPNNYLDNEYELKDSVKSVNFINGKPTFRKEHNHIYVHAMHFQGKTKPYISDYYINGRLYKEMFRFYFKKIFKKLTHPKNR